MNTGDVLLSYNSDHGLIAAVLTERLADYVIRLDTLTNYGKRNRVTDQNASHIFLSYNEENREFVESLALRLHGDARLSFWFAPWHSIPGQPSRSRWSRHCGRQMPVPSSSLGQIKSWAKRTDAGGRLSNNCLSTGFPEYDTD